MGELVISILSIQINKFCFIYACFVCLYLFFATLDKYYQSVYFYLIYRPFELFIGVEDIGGLVDDKI